MVFYLARRKGYRVKMLPEFAWLVRCFRSLREAACALFEPTEKTSDQYDLFEIDLNRLTVKKVDIPEIKFE